MRASVANVLRAAGHAPAAQQHARASVLQRDGATGPRGESADLEIIVSTEGLARDGGVVPLGAWDLEAYRRNPVVQLAHGRRFPIARAEWTVPDRDRGVLRSGWTFHRESPESELAAKLYGRGFMRSASVGFRLVDHHRPNQQEAEEMGVPEGEEILWIADRAELLEASAVAVPADPGALAPLDRALTSARAHGVDVEPLSRRLRQLRQRCDAGDDRACRRLRQRRGASRRDVSRIRVGGLSARLVTDADGRRWLAVPGDDGERAVELEDGETPEDALAELLADGARQAARSPFRSRTAGRHRGGRPDARYR